MFWAQAKPLSVPTCPPFPWTSAKVTGEKRLPLTSVGWGQHNCTKTGTSAVTILRLLVPLSHNCQAWSCWHRSLNEQQELCLFFSRPLKATSLLSFLSKWIISEKLNGVPVSSAIQRVPPNGVPLSECKGKQGTALCRSLWMSSALDFGHPESSLLWNSLEFISHVFPTSNTEMFYQRL